MDFTRIWAAKKPGEPRKDAGEPFPPALSAALAEMERSSRNRPELEALGPTIVGILKATFSIPGSPVPSLAPEDAQSAFLMERIREGWSEGVAAVRVIVPALDRDRMLARVRAINEIADRDHPPARGLREQLAAEPDRIVEGINALLVAGEEGMGKLLEQQDGIDPAYAFSVFRLALLGELGEWSMRISGHRSLPGWSRRDCPVCGAAPALAESRGLEQQRFLHVCGVGRDGRAIACSVPAAENPITALFAISLPRKTRTVAG